MKPGPAAIWAHYEAVTPEIAGELEQLGYSAVWLGGSPPADLAAAGALLASTSRLVIGTSIVNIWQAPAPAVAESFSRLEARYPGRFILGIGAGHRERDSDYRKPYEALADYLDELDAAGVPASQRALAALGPRVLRLAADRTAGALPYLATPDHTRKAREALGPDALLVSEQKVVIDGDPERARELGRASVGPYLKMSNYVANLGRLGFSEQDTAYPGSDRLIDVLAVHGDAGAVAAGLRAHLTAGADQVAIQVLTPDGDILPAARALAGQV